MECGRRLLLFVLSFLSFGASLGMMIWTLIVMHKYHLDDENKTLWIIVIVVTVILGVIFLFSIYASCCGQSCSLIVLGIMFIIIAVCLLIVGIVILASRSTFIDSLYPIWREGVDTPWVDEIQNSLNCCGFYNSSDYPSSSCDAALPGCAREIDSTVKNSSTIIAIVLAVAIVLYIIAATMAFKQSSVAEKAPDALD